MRILIVGATGFIGGHLVSGLAKAGHRVVCAGRDAAGLRRRFPACETLPCDLAMDTVADWRGRLRGMDAVVNAAGILRGDLAAVQGEGPIRLFEACAAAGLPHVIQVSGLGAVRGSQAAFLASKVPADERLRDLAGGRAWAVLRPGVVIGAGGQSTAMFEALAAFPLPIGIGDGVSRLSVVAVEEVVAVVAALLERRTGGFIAGDLVAPLQVTTDELTQRLRAWLGLPPRRMLHVPYGVLAFAAAWGKRLGFGSLTPETLAMLRAGLAGDSQGLEDVLGRPIGTLDEALATRSATRGDRLAARLFWLRLPLRLGLAAIWIGSGLASLAARDAPDVAVLLANLGIGPALAGVPVLLGAGLDLLLGCLLLLNIRARSVGWMQIGVMLGYTLLATVAQPSLWAQPFGPLLKNIAMLLATLAMIVLEEAP